MWVFTCRFSIISNSSNESANLFDLFEVTGFATDIDITGERYAVPSSIEFDEISISFRVTKNKRYFRKKNAERVIVEKMIRGHSKLWNFGWKLSNFKTKKIVF